MTRAMLAFQFLIAILVAQTTTVWARDVYFMGSAVSNTTADLSLRNCNTNPVIFAGNLFYTCSLGALRCKVAVYNPSPSNQSVTVDMSFNIQYPRTTAGVQSFNTNSAQANSYHPYFDRTGTALPQALIVGPVTEPTAGSDIKGCNGWCSYLGPTGAGLDLNYTAVFTPAVPGIPVPVVAAGAPAAPTVTVSSNGNIYIVEKKIHLPYFAVTPGNIIAGRPNPTGPVREIFPFHANAKIFSLCSGKITATDVPGAVPGFVVATGSVDYIADSYQNPVINYGGWINNDAGSGFGGVVSEMGIACRAHASSAHYARDIAVNNRSLIAPVQASLHVHSWGRADCITGVNASCDINHLLNNKEQKAGLIQNNSAIFPQHVSSVPLLINGGAPF